jgi:hypothetical protein
MTDFMENVVAKFPFSTHQVYYITVDAYGRVNGHVGSPTYSHSTGKWFNYSAMVYMGDIEVPSNPSECIIKNMEPSAWNDGIIEPLKFEHDRWS